MSYPPTGPISTPPHGHHPPGSMPMAPYGPPPKKKSKAPLIITAVAVGVAVLGCCGISAIIASTSDTTSTSSPQRTDAGPQQPAAAEAAPTTAARTTAAPTTPPGPVTAFADGIYEVGNGPGLVPPGKYKTTVPANSYGCYWERLSGTSGNFDDIIANDNAGKGQPVIVTIGASDKAFKTERCGTWQKA